MNEQPFVLSQHAREAMMLRRVSMDDVLAAIRTPETTDKSRDGVKRFFRDNICVVTVFNGRIIVKTVLYRYGDRWTDKDVRQRDLR